MKRREAAAGPQNALQSIRNNNGVLLVPPTVSSFEEEEESEGFNQVSSSSESTALALSSLRSQRLSDTYPLRMQLVTQTKPTITRVYQSIISNLIIDPLLSFFFPRILNNQIQENVPGLNLLFRPTTQVQLLCSWTCDEGHVCRHQQGHSQRHECIFGHKEGDPIVKCGHLCDCRFCEAPCSLKPGHSGTHQCYFRHALRDIPTNRKEQETFRDEKAIGGYMSELAFISNEDMKYSHIPTTLNEEDEKWWE